MNRAACYFSNKSGANVGLGSKWTLKKNSVTSFVTNDPFLITLLQKFL